MQNTLIELLQRLEVQLKDNDLWQTQPIEPALLQSQQPFCVDTLRFEQWLQFVFIEKMNALLAQGLPLPNNIAIAPMGEIAWQQNYADVMATLSQIDALFGGAHE
ncbi:YqcC family protein [Pseudoalteromonas sp. SSDWG2]|uniref:YqcC family protein n=1 Tax=Pseudoalteromonas sp. SSDWG2 TaxID=3139391 RepID=UPI003BA9DEC7